MTDSMYYLFDRSRSTRFHVDVGLLDLGYIDETEVPYFSVDDHIWTALHRWRRLLPENAPAMSMSTNKKDIVVLGAGVVGLTTAIKLQETGKYHVTIVAEVLPSDPQSIRYTSFWAGAHHIYNPLNGTSQHTYEEQTFKILWEMSAPGSDSEECFLRITQTEYFFEERSKPEPLEKMPNFRYLNPDELTPSAKSGMTFSTITIDTPIYLDYLLARFVNHGGRILRGSVTHIYQVLEGGTALFPGGSNLDPKPDALIVCVGLGARFLGGVEDKSVYPVRGQTVVVRAPWVRFGRTDTNLTEDRITYIIPRRSSDVIVGGTRLVDDWYPKPRPETTEDILLRGLTLCPELASLQVRSTRPPTINDVLPLVVGEGCGLRPARKEGVRIELEWIDGAKVKREGKVAVVHNYGHGGFGFQSSWGCAMKVLEILDNALSGPEAV